MCPPPDYSTYNVDNNDNKFVMFSAMLILLRNFLFYPWIVFYNPTNTILSIPIELLGHF